MKRAGRTLARLTRLHSTARTLARSLSARDALFQRVPTRARCDLIEAALSEGRACARSIARDWGSDPWFIAQRLGIEVVDSPAEANFGSVTLFAQYTGRPPTITLYPGAIAKLRRLVASQVRAMLDPHACKAMFLAHELYHHLARIALKPPPSRSCRVTLVELGPWRWTSGIACVEEIEAGAFAQNLLGLSFHPYLLDLLWTRGQRVAQKERVKR